MHHEKSCTLSTPAEAFAEIRKQIQALDTHFVHEPTSEILLVLKREVDELRMFLANLSLESSGTLDSWPRDLNEAENNSMWGADPEEIKNG